MYFFDVFSAICYFNSILADIKRINKEL